MDGPFPSAVGEPSIWKAAVATPQVKSSPRAVRAVGSMESLDVHGTPLTLTTSTAPRTVTTAAARYRLW